MDGDKGEVSKGPSAEDIESALNKTGFLLEHRVAQILRNYATVVTIGKAFLDPESGKSREIDVFASLEGSIDGVEAGNSPHIFVELAIECKNSSGPFVLIGDHGRDYHPWTGATIHVTFDPLKFGFPKALGRTLRSMLNLDTLPGMPTRDDFSGHQLLRMNRQGGNWKADNNAIYDSILYPLAKAWKHEADDWKNAEEGWQYASLSYTFPIIVTSGGVYVVDATEEDLDIHEVKWAAITRDFHSKELNCNFRADVVSFDNLDDYLNSQVLRVFDGATEALAENLRLFDPEWLITNLGEPRDRKEFDEWLRSYQEERQK
jgi:hypothetical protein